MAAHAREPRRARFALRTLPAIASASCKDRPRASSSRSACGCIMSIGATPTRRRCCWCMAGATIAATGTGSPRDLRDDYHVIAPDLRGHGDCAWSLRRQLRAWPDFIYDLAQLIHQQQLAPVTHHRPFARRQHRAALYRHLSRDGAPAGRHRGPRARRRRSLAERDAQADRRAHARAGSTSSARSPAACRAATPSIEDAFARMQEANTHLSPEQARHLTAARRQPERGRHL